MLYLMLKIVSGSWQQNMTTEQVKRLSPGSSLSSVINQKHVWNNLLVHSRAEELLNRLAFPVGDTRGVTAEQISEWEKWYNPVGNVEQLLLDKTFSQNRLVSGVGKRNTRETCQQAAFNLKRRSREANKGASSRAMCTEQLWSPLRSPVFKESCGPILCLAWVPDPSSAIGHPHPLPLRPPPGCSTPRTFKPRKEHNPGDWSPRLR